MKVMTVVGALVREYGRIMICNRLDGLGWEFPGGKVEEGETDQEALVRELKEELGVRAQAFDLVEAVVLPLPNKILHLKVYDTLMWPDEIRCTVHTGFRFVTPGELMEMRELMLPADRPVVDKLYRESRRG